MKIGSDTFLRSFARSLALVGALASAGVAHAQPSTTTAAATAQFDNGRKLVKQGKYAEACAAFEQSQKLGPAAGTLYNLAGCYVKLGKLASAWAAYRELAQTDANAARKADSDKQARALEHRLPRLVIDVANRPAGLVVTLDGADVTAALGSANPVDLGTFHIHATAPQFKDTDAEAKVTEEGKTIAVSIVLAAAPIAAPAVTTVEPHASAAEPTLEHDDAPAPSHRRTYVAVIGVGGIALVATGLVFGKLASGTWDDAKAACPAYPRCTVPADVEKGNALVQDARKQATISTLLVAGGGAAITVAAILWLTAPSHPTTTRSALRLTPHADPSQVGITLGGTF